MCVKPPRLWMTGCCRWSRLWTPAAVSPREHGMGAVEWRAEVWTRTSGKRSLTHVATVTDGLDVLVKPVQHHEELQPDTDAAEAEQEQDGGGDDEEDDGGAAAPGEVHAEAAEGDRQDRRPDGGQDVQGPDELRRRERGEAEVEEGRHEALR